MDVYTFHHIDTKSMMSKCNGGLCYTVADGEISVRPEGHRFTRRTPAVNVGLIHVCDHWTGYKNHRSKLRATLKQEHQRYIAV